MSKKYILLFFSQICYQVVSSENVPIGFNPSTSLPTTLPAPECTPLSYITGLRPSDLSASNGRTFTSLSSSPIPPNGMAVDSGATYGGTIAVGGSLPFLGTAGITAAVPTLGAGAVVYGCGGKTVEMTAEDIAAYYFVDEIGPYGPDLAPYSSYKPGLSKYGPIGTYGCY